MKTNRTYLMLVLAALAFGSCQKDQTPVDPIQPDSELISFNIAIPVEQTLETRGTEIPEGAISSLYVLVFDQNGGFLSRSHAVRTGGPGQYKVLVEKTDPDLPAAQKKRIVHFICNYDWPGWSDEANLGKHENEVLGYSSVKERTTAYWSRFVLESGISSSSFPVQVKLLRNVAKISITGQTGNLSNARFALGNWLDQGTIAPFNPQNSGFDENYVLQSPFGTRQPALEAAFVPIADNEITCYESQNSVTTRPMYVILKGRYTGTFADTYYKIETRMQDQETLLDIRRNYHYLITITEIIGPGVGSLQEAIDGPASNSLLYTVVPQEYTSISDGISGLYVGYTSKTLVLANTEYSIPFAYYPLLSNGIEDNTNITCTLEQTGDKPVINPTSEVLTKTPGNASYTFKTVGSLPPSGEIHTAKVVIKATANGVELRREIAFNLHRPTAFSGVFINPGTLSRSPNQPVTLSFTLPDNIGEHNFPMEVFITTKLLSPDKTKTQLSLDYSIPGSYRYKFLAPGPGQHKLYFLTTLQIPGNETKSETLQLEADIFTPYLLPISN